MRIPKVTLQLRGRVWWLTTMVKGKRFRESTEETDKAKALLIGEKILAQRLRENQDEPIPEMELAEDLFRRLNEDKRAKGGNPRSESTLRNYERYADRFNRHFGKVKLSHLSSRKIIEWREFLMKEQCESTRNPGATLSKKTVTEHLVWLSSVYHHFGFATNPCNKSVVHPKKTDAERQEEMEYYSPEEVETLIATATAMMEAERAKEKTPVEVRFDEISKAMMEAEKKKNGDTGKPKKRKNKFAFRPRKAKPNGLVTSDWREFRFWLKLIAFTGMRIGEAMGIRFKDIDKRDIGVTVTSAKTKTSRFVSLLPNPISESDSDEVIRSKSDDNAWLALTELENIARIQYGRDGKEVTPDSPIFMKYERWFFKMLQTLCVVADVPFKGVHALRHSFVSKALKDWGDIYRVAKYVGHKSIWTTYAVYGHMLKDSRLPFSYEETDSNR